MSLDGSYTLDTYIKSVYPSTYAVKATGDYLGFLGVLEVYRR